MIERFVSSLLIILILISLCTTPYISIEKYVNVISENNRANTYATNRDTQESENTSYNTYSSPYSATKNTSVYNGNNVKVGAITPVLIIDTLSSSATRRNLSSSIGFVAHRFYGIHVVVFNYITKTYIIYDIYTDTLIEGSAVVLFNQSTLNTYEGQYFSPIIVVINPTNASSDWIFTLITFEGVFEYYLQKLGEKGDILTDFIVLWEDLYVYYTKDDWRDHVVRITIFSNNTVRIAVLTAKGDYMHDFYIIITNLYPIEGVKAYTKPYYDTWEYYADGYYREIPGYVYYLEAMFLLVINLYNINQNPFPDPGGKISVVLYDSFRNYIAENRVQYLGGSRYVSVSFAVQHPGLYIIEVYHNPSVQQLSTEYWGWAEVSVSSYITSYDFTRNTPYAEYIYPYNNLTHLPGSIYPYIVVKNPGSEPRNVVVNLKFYSFTGTLVYNINSSSLHIYPGESRNISFGPLDLDVGSYYVIYTVYAEINGRFLITDQHLATLSVCTRVKEDVIRVYSEYEGVFYSGIKFYNTFYVYVNDSMSPTYVHGLLNGNILYFRYNDSLNMWLSEFNTGDLPPGKYSLIVVAVFPDNEIANTTLKVVVMHAPKFLLNIEYLAIKSPIDVKVKINLITDVNKLFGKSYTLIVELEITLSFSEKMVAERLGGDYSAPITMYLAVSLSSNGEVKIIPAAELSLRKKFFVMSVEGELSIIFKASGEIEVSTHTGDPVSGILEISVGISGTFAKRFPTPWGVTITIPILNKEITLGLTVTLAVCVESSYTMLLVPTNDTRQYLFEILPLGVQDVKGYIGVPFLLSGDIGFEVVGVGVRGFLQGGGGFGIFFSNRPGLVKGSALVGYARVGYVVNLVLFNVSGSLVLWKGEVVKGEVNQEDRSLLIGSINDLLERLNYPPLGEDWVNGSWIGIVYENIPTGYSYSAVSYGDNVYIYFTKYGDSRGVQITGMIFTWLNATNDYIPFGNMSYTASPYLFITKDKKIGLLLVRAYSTSPDLSDLQLILQMSIKEDMGWKSIINVTRDGIVLSYLSDGEFIYVLRSPVTGIDIDIIYGNTMLEVYDLNGNLLEQRKLPYAIGFIDVMDGKILVKFMNGTTALIEGEQAIYFNKGEKVGFIKELNAIYIYVNGTLAIFGNSINKSISLDKNVLYVEPIFVEGKLLLVVQEMEIFRIYLVDCDDLVLIRSYRIPNVKVIKYSTTDRLLYIFPYIVHNEVNSTIMGIIIPIKPPQPKLTTILDDNVLHISWSVEHPQEYNITRVLLRIYRDEELYYERDVEPLGYELFIIQSTGTYTVSLKIETLFGCHETNSTIYISDLPPTNTPIRTFTYTPIPIFNQTTTTLQPSSVGLISWIFIFLIIVTIIVVAAILLTITLRKEIQ